MSQLRGIEQFRRNLEALDRKVRNKILRQALRDGAKRMAASVKSRAPVSSGKLKRSVKVRTGRRKKDTISVDVVVTGGHETPMVAAVEYGRDGQAPRPFIRPAFQAEKDPARDLVFAQVKAAIAAAGR